MSTRLTVPSLPPDALCETCGNRNDSHPYRHPFVSKLAHTDPWKRIAALEAKNAALSNLKHDDYATLLQRTKAKCAELGAELRDIDEELADHDALDKRLAAEGRQPSDRLIRIASLAASLKRSLATSKRRGAERDKLLDLINEHLDVSGFLQVGDYVTERVTDPTVIAERFKMVEDAARRGGGEVTRD